jgi:hypothetical protein
MFKYLSRGAAMSIVVTYLAYLLISVGLTVLAGRVLSRSGRVFLVDALGGSDSAARGISNLIVVSFYLISLGFVALTMRTSSDSVSVRQAIQLLATKVGLVLLVLGALYLAGIVTLTRLRRRLKGQQLDAAATTAAEDSSARTALWHPATRRIAP